MILENYYFLPKNTYMYLIKHFVMVLQNCHLWMIHCLPNPWYVLKPFAFKDVIMDNRRNFNYVVDRILAVNRVT